MDANKIYQGNALDVLKTFPKESIDCIMTSPPYWGLRDYGEDTSTDWDGWKGQLGLEPDFNDYIKHLCGIFDEVKRILKTRGTCWVNIGDTYGGSLQGYGTIKRNIDSGFQDTRDGYYASSNAKPPMADMDYPDKCLVMIPFRFAIEMVNRGWRLRNTLIWHKPNCLPSSVKDRFTVDFEHVFFFVKSKKYWFETQYEKNLSIGKTGWEKSGRGDSSQTAMVGDGRMFNPLGRNKRTVWTITTQPFPDAHFAVFPEELCETPIKAGCPEFICKKCGKAREKIFESEIIETEEYLRQRENQKKYAEECMGAGSVPQSEFFKTKFKGYTDCGCNAGWDSGVVLDPFMGSGTVGLVALKQNKKFVGIELKPAYIEMAMKRLKPWLEQTRLSEFE